MKSPRRVFYGWWIALAGALILVTISGTFFYGFTAFVDPLRDEFGWAYATISLIFTLRNMEEGFLSPVAGYLADRFGPRKTLIAGICLVGLGYLLLSRTSGLGTFYAYYTILAIAFSALSNTTVFIPLAHWFKKRLTFVLGLVSAGMGASGIMVPLLVWLIARYEWRTTFVIVGLMTFVVGIPLSLVIRHKPQPYGYLPDGEVPGPRVAGTQPAASTAEKAATTPESDEGGLTWREALRTRTLWILGGVFALSGLATNGMFSLMMSHLTESGLSRELAGTVVTFTTAMSISGKLGFGWLGDRIDKRRLLPICLALEVAGIIIFAQIRQTWQIVPFLLLFGPGFGGIVPLLPALQREYFGAKAFGTIRGLTLMFVSLGGIPSPLIAGWMRDITGNFRLAFLVLAMPLLAAIPLPLLLKRNKQSGRSEKRRNNQD